MRIKILMCIFFLSYLNAYSQRGGIINYVLKIKRDSLYPQDSVNLKITFFNNKSLQQVVIPKKIDTNLIILSENHSSKRMSEILGREYFLLKDFDKNKILSSESIFIKSYLVEDTLGHFDWKISKEKRKKSGYNCFKATTYFRGRLYTAWFTEDIAISNGPWKFCGLPGLIIELSDSESKFIFKLSGISLKMDFDSNIIRVPDEYAKDKPISPQKFVSMYNKKVNEFSLMSKIVTYDAYGGYGSTKITLPELMEKF